MPYADGTYISGDSFNGLGGVYPYGNRWFACPEGYALDDPPSMCFSTVDPSLPPMLSSAMPSGTPPSIVGTGTAVAAGGARRSSAGSVVAAVIPAPMIAGGGSVLPLVLVSLGALAALWFSMK